MSASVAQRAFEFAGDARLVGLGSRLEPEHQGTRERPRLRGQIAAAQDAHAGFLHHFAGHRLLGHLARLHEPGDHRIAAFGPTGLPAQQQALAVRGRNDDGRIDTRVMVVAAAGAVADETAAPNSMVPPQTPQ
jgi:hypothetical protein